MLGEIHNNKQEYEWLQSLVANPEFADRVDDIVMELGNSLYQKSVDRYIAGEAVPLEEVQRAWRNTLAGVYCELSERECKQIFVWELEALRRLTHVGYYEAIAARPRVLTKACWARVCCEST
jgi:hypothetical protein